MQKFRREFCCHHTADVAKPGAEGSGKNAWISCNGGRTQATWLKGTVSDPNKKESQCT
jgi:hypothetical protein